MLPGPHPPGGEQGPSESSTGLCLTPPKPQEGIVFNLYLKLLRRALTCGRGSWVRSEVAAPPGGWGRKCLLTQHTLGAGPRVILCPSPTTHDNPMGLEL